MVTRVWCAGKLFSAILLAFIQILCLAALVARLSGTLCAGRRKQVVARKAVPRRCASRAGGISPAVAVAEAPIRFDRDLVDHPL
jgi:hypothetical protein